MLGTDVTDPIGDLRSVVPLACSRPWEKDSVDIDFVTEQFDVDGGARTELNDVPASFAPKNRRYRARQVAVETITMPSDLCAGRGVDYLDRVAKYLAGAVA